MAVELELQLFESPAIRWLGRELRPPSSRTLPLLAYVALKSGPASRRELVQLLWQDALLVNLRQELAKIRSMPGAEEWFEADPKSGRVTVRACSDLQRVRAAMLAGESGYVVDRYAGLGNLRLLDGLELDFLPPPFQEWLEQENSDLEASLIDTLNAHALVQEQEGDLGGAIDTYRHLLRLDPFAESAHRAVMRLELAAGRPEAAAHQLDRARHVFRSEFEVEPSAETLALAPMLTAPSQASHWQSAAGKRSLPFAKTPFVGRDSELEELSLLFDEPGTRIVTVVGLGGAGKSRLALEFARRFEGRFAAGVVYLPLAHSERADLVPASLATILGLPADDLNCCEVVLEHLQEREYLLVFDNVEQLVAAAELVVEIVERSPATRVLLTSQVPLGLQLERTFWLHGLRLPEAEDSHPEQSEAVRLFRQSARLPPEEDQVQCVAEVCRLLNGLPLGIELAASLTEHLSCQEIAHELSSGNYELLVADQVDRPFRHRALRALLEATWQALGLAARRQLASLSIFSRAFSRQDALTVAGVGFQDLKHLIERSLLVYESGGQLKMHAVVQWYAAEQLLAAPRGQAQKARLHLKAAEQIRSSHTRTTPRTTTDLSPWLDAVRHLIEAGSFDDACRFLNEFDIRLLLRWGQARTVLEIHQELYPSLTDNALKGRSQNSQGLALRRLGRLPEAVSAFELALRHCRESGDLDNEATYMGNLALVYSVAGDLNEAIRLHLEAADISRSLGHRRNEGIDLGCVGLAYNRLGQVDRAIHYHELALFVSREAGDRHSEANHLGNLARIYSTRAELVHALAYVRAALALRRELNDRRGEALDMHCIAEVHEQQGEGDQAEEHYRAAISLNRSIGEGIGECEAQFALARLLVSRAEQAEALSCVRQALAVNRKVGDRHMEAALLSWLGDQYELAGESDSSVALWLLAQSVVPERTSELGCTITEKLSGSDLLRTSESLKLLLNTGSDLASAATGIAYTLPHLDLLGLSHAD